MTACARPPTGWRCTREAGHDGPCAALPTTPADETLPKRGDRVRVTNVGGLAKFSVGDEHILQMDAKQHHDDWIYFDFVRVGERFPEFSGAVKVEILERAEPDKLDGFTPEQCQAFAVEEQAGFARGMRRAVEIAEGIGFGAYGNRSLAYVDELKEAIEKELSQP